MNAPQLIAYADRFGGSLRGLTEILRGPLADTFGGVHILPFYFPYDGADAGFDPQDHTRPDPRLGTWPDVADLARTHTVMADVIVNHMSSESPQFLDYSEKGEASAYAGLFLTLDAVFPHGASERDLLAVYRPRPGLPLTYAANSLNRCMGAHDLYPFVLSAPAIAKLGYIHRLVRGEAAA